MIGLPVFSAVIVAALAVTSLAPIVLIGLLVRDWKKGELW